MKTPYFPNILEDQIFLINRVIRTLDENPTYLEDPNCGYSQPVKDFLVKMSATASAAPVVDLFTGDDIESVQTQVKKLMNDLEAFAQTLTNADHSEKMQYFKTKTTLLEKLVTHLEKANNLKQINEFRGTVIQFMDEVLTPDQITTFMQRIDGVLSNGR